MIDNIEQDYWAAKQMSSTLDGTFHSTEEPNAVEERIDFDFFYRYQVTFNEENLMSNEIEFEIPPCKLSFWYYLNNMY